MRPLSTPNSLVDTGPDLRRDVVEVQLDDLNGLAEALVDAHNEEDSARIAEIRERIQRRLVGMGWNLATSLDAVLAYARARTDEDDELFAPALALTSMAPEHPETAALLARLSPEARELLACIGG